MQELDHDPNTIQFYIPSGLPRGFYDLTFQNAQGEKIRSYQALKIKEQIPLDLKAGLNLFGYPGQVPAEYSTSLRLMGSLEGIAQALQQENPKKTSYWRSHTLLGSLFTIKERRGYLLYAPQDWLLTALISDYFSQMDEVLNQIDSELQEGTNWVSFPIQDTGSLSSEVFGKLREFPYQNKLSGVQRLSPLSGKWEFTYGFYNQSCGQNFPIKRGEGYQIYKY